MKILSMHNFVSERMKFKPVTNAEMEHIKKEIETNKPCPVSLSSMKSIDDMQPGWIIFITDHHANVKQSLPRIAVPNKYVENIFGYAVEYPYIFARTIFSSISSNKTVVYIQSSVFHDNFPYSTTNRYYIDRIYRWHVPNLQSICKSKNDFIDWYDSIDFDDLLK